MITNPTNYTFTPPADLTGVTGYVATLKLSSGDTVTSETLSESASGHTFSGLRAAVLATSFSNTELTFSVQSVGAGSSHSIAVNGDTTVKFLPDPNPPTNVVIHA
jgi:hypothetical protein